MYFLHKIKRVFLYLYHFYSIFKFSYILFFIEKFFQVYCFVKLKNSNVKLQIFKNHRVSPLVLTEHIFHVLYRL